MTIPPPASRPARLPGPGPLASLRYAPALLRRPYTVLPEMHRRYGPVCEVGGQTGSDRFRFVFLFGREANELVLSAQVDNFRWRDALAVLIPVDGDTALVVSDGDDHKRRRRLVQPAFSRKRVDSYLPIVAEEVDAAIDGWAPGAVVDAYGRLRARTRRIVVRALFGPRLEARADELGDELQVAIDYVNRPPALRFDHELPATAYRRAMRARRRADAIVFDEIAHRRSIPDAGDRGDVLSALLAAQDEGGAGGLTDEEVRDQVVSLIAAGYDTTSAAIGWSIHALYTHAEVLAKARAEVDRIVGEDALTPEHLADLPYLGGVVSESLRLWPPGPMSARRAVDDFAYAGHRIPGGRFVVYSAYVTHRLAELWPDPERFDPGRWVPGSATHREPEPYSFVPFGGGYRRCIGFGMATLEITTALARLVRRVDLEPLGEAPAPTGLATMSPRGGVRCRVTPRST
ncbi:MAG TPA: cytochrome P450 [Acidimicrobiales bacterium]|nr:cytochrome P450 [Acidimicrobiales bacterium]